MNKTPKELLDALRAHQFVLGSYSWDEKTSAVRKLWSSFDDPFVTIISSEEQSMGHKLHDLAVKFGQSSPEFEECNYMAGLANIRERARLLKFLEKFYTDRNTPLSVRLIVQSSGGGVSSIHAQGAQIMRLPENLPEREAWLGAVREEMLAFAEFLTREKP